jgi:hypothetical protein
MHEMPPLSKSLASFDFQGDVHRLIDTSSKESTDVYWSRLQWMRDIRRELSPDDPRPRVVHIECVHPRRRLAMGRVYHVREILASGREVNVGIDVGKESLHLTAVSEATTSLKHW